MCRNRAKRKRQGKKQNRGGAHSPGVGFFRGGGAHSGGGRGATAQYQECIQAPSPKAKNTGVDEEKKTLLGIYLPKRGKKKRTCARRLGPPTMGAPGGAIHPQTPKQNTVCNKQKGKLQKREESTRTLMDGRKHGESSEVGGRMDRKNRAHTRSGHNGCSQRG